MEVSLDQVRLGGHQNALGGGAIDAEQRPVSPAPAERPVIEFLLTGGLTLLLFPLFFIGRRLFDADNFEYELSFVAFYAAYVINDPHFAVTYLLFYRKAKARLTDPNVSLVQRSRYFVSGFLVPAALIAFSAAALISHSAFMMGVLFQAMFFLVSWHYVKQAFGVLSTLSARRGVRFSIVEKRLILAHCISAWFYARANPVDPGSDYLEQGVLFHSFAHPAWALPATSLLFWLGTAGAVYALVSFFRRTGRLPPLGALSAFLISIWIWVVFIHADPLLIYVIPGLHSLQYLYFVWLQQSGEARAFEGAPHFGRPEKTRLGVLLVSALLLGFMLFHGAPDILDTMLSTAKEGDGDPLGPTPYLAAIFAFVNIHHYFMDAALWRREVPETRYLMSPN